MVVRVEKVAGGLVDADMGLNAGEQNLATTGSAQLMLEAVEAAGAEAGFGQGLLPGEQLSDFGDRRANTFGVLL